MAITEICGWECNIAVAGAILVPDEKHWDSPVAGIAVSVTNPRTGTRCLTATAAAESEYLGKTVARTIVAGRVYVRFETLPDATTHFIGNINANGSGLIRCTSAGQLTIQAGAGSTVNLGSPISTGQYYRIDWLYDCSTGTASLKAKLDGGTEVESTNAQASVNITAIRLGPQTTVTATVRFDDFIAGDAAGDYPFGGGTVEKIIPSSDGTHSFTAGDFGYDSAGADVAVSATDVNTYVDDGRLDTSAEFIRQKVARSTGYCEVNFANPTNSGDPLAVNLLSSWHAAGTGADTMGIKWNDGGTLADGIDVAGDGLADVSNTTVGNAENIRTTKPSGGAWTNAALTGLAARFGYSTDVVAIPYCDAIMLEVAFPEAAAADQLPPPIIQPRQAVQRAANW